MTEDAWEVIREVLLDLHDLDRHLRDEWVVYVEPGEGCEDCEILLAPLTTLREQAERQEAALRDCHVELKSIAYQYATVQGMREAAEKVLLRHEALFGEWFSVHEKKRIEARLSTGEPSRTEWCNRCHHMMKLHHDGRCDGVEVVDMETQSDRPCRCSTGEPSE